MEFANSLFPFLWRNRDIAGNVGSVALGNDAFGRFFGPVEINDEAREATDDKCRARSDMQLTAHAFGANVPSDVAADFILREPKPFHFGGNAPPGVFAGL